MAALGGTAEAVPYPKLLEPEFFSSLRRGKPRLYTNRGFSAACEGVPFPKPSESEFFASCEAVPFPFLPSLYGKSRAALVLGGLREALAKADPSLRSG
jgi:hypothetical protein